MAEERHRVEGSGSEEELSGKELEFESDVAIFATSRAPEASPDIPEGGVLPINSQLFS